MPPRDFNLDELLGREHVEHYLRFITPGPANIFGRSLPAGYGNAWPGGDPSTYRVTENDETYSWDQGPQDDIELRGLGAATCSSSVELACLTDRFVWDVCEYYRILRVDPRASRSQLRRALRRLGRRQGHHTARQAYAASQLLNPVIRRLYDEATPDKPFFFDKETTERIKRAAIQQAIREHQLHSQDEVTPEQVDEVFSRWGIRQNWQEESEETIAARTRMRDVLARGKDGPASYALGGSLSPWSMQWSWYAWHEGRERPGERWDPRYLETWQRLLRDAFRNRKVTVSFGVGLHSGLGWKLFRLSDGVCIVFLARDEYPDPDLAADAADYIVNSFVAVQGRNKGHGSTHRRSGI